MQLERRMIALLSALPVVIACSGGETVAGGGKGDGVDGATSLSVSPASDTMRVGETMRWQAFLHAGSNAVPVSATWRSTQASIASVSSSGDVSGVGRGSAYIVASAGRFSDSAAVTVVASVASVSIVPAEMAAPVNDTVRVAASVVDATGNERPGSTVTWAVADTLVASVTPDGLIRTGRAGSTMVIASAGDASATARIRVTPRAGNSLMVVLPSPDLLVGEQAMAAAVLRDSVGVPVSSGVVAWTSDAPAVASVDASGRVTALSLGTATVTATSGGVSGGAVVRVVPASSQSAAPDFTAIVRGIRPRGFRPADYTLVAPAAGGVEYHVSPSGSDADPGTRGAPFRTIGKGAQVARAGDVVTIAAGTYSGTVRVAHSGTREAPIVFQAAVAGGVVLSDTTATFQPAGWTGLPMRDSGERWITLRGLVFRDWGGNTRGRHGVRAITGWHIDQCLFERAGYVGLQVAGDDVRVERSTFQYHYALSLGAYAPDNPALVPDPVRYPFISGTVIRDVVLRGNATGADLPTGGAIEQSVKFLHTANTLVDNIEAYENNGPGWWWDSQNVDWTISNSYFHHNRGGSGYGVHVEIGWGPGLVVRNVFMNNTGPGVFVNSSQNTTIRENLFIDNRMCVMLVNEPHRGFPMHDVTITGNLCKGWRQYSAIHALGGTFTTPAEMRIMADGNTYEPGNVPGLAWWPVLNGATKLSQLQAIYGWEARGRLSPIKSP